MNYNTVDVSDLLTNMHNSTTKQELENNYQEIQIYISSLDLMNELKDKMTKTADCLHFLKLQEMNA